MSPSPEQASQRPIQVAYPMGNPEHGDITGYPFFGRDIEYLSAGSYCQAVPGI